MESDDPVRIVLTPDQRELVRRMSGKDVEAIELAPDEATDGEGPLKFRWRISAATGIPRLGWTNGDEETPPPVTEAASG